MVSPAAGDPASTHRARLSLATGTNGMIHRHGETGIGNGAEYEQTRTRGSVATGTDLAQP